ncbi:MAG: ATP-binding cassette domain-containing protein, partial [Bacteroidota bacterium]
GTACLLSIVQFYGKKHSLSYLKLLTGARLEDCNLIGLRSAAEQIGFEAKGLKLSIKSLETLGYPVILNVIQQKVSLSRYVICYGHKKRNGETIFIIGDPHEGLKELTSNELNVIWKNKICISLKPTDSFFNHLPGPIKNNTLGQLLHSEPRLLYFTALLALVQSLLYLTPIYFIDQFAATGFLTLPKTVILYSFLGLIGLFAFAELIRHIRLQLVLSYSMLTTKKLHQEFMQNFVLLPKRYLDSEKEVMNLKCNDVQKFNVAYSSILGKGILMIVLMCSAAVALAYCALPSLLITAFFIGLSYLLAKIPSKSVAEIDESVYQNNAMFKNLFREVATKQSEIKILGKQGEYNNSLEKFVTTVQYTSYALSVLKSRYQSIQQVLFVLLFVTLATQLLFTPLATGTTLIVFYLVGLICTATTYLGSAKGPLAEIHRFLNQIDELKYIASTVDPGKVPIKQVKVLDLKQVNFAMEKGYGPNILKCPISLSAKKGEMIGIVGQNGSGKTLLSQILLKQYDYTEGSILLNENTELKEAISFDYQQLLAYVPEKTVIFNGSIISNIAFEQSLHIPASVNEFVLKNRLERFFENLPSRGNKVIGQGGLELSIAEQKVLSVARALYKKPQLLILDEPFAALSKEMASYIFGMLQSAQKDMIILLFTSHEDLARKVCNRVYSLNQQAVPEVSIS